MPTPIPIIAASWGVQSTTSITRVPSTAISDRLTTIANSALSSGSPIATTPNVKKSTSAATRMPISSPAPPVSAVDQWMMSPPSATWTPPWPSSASVFSAISLICLTSASPAAPRNWIVAKVILPSFETGAPSANGSPTASTSGDFAISARTFSICGLIAGVQHAAVLDREDHAGAVARLLREALGEQVVRPLGLRPRKVEDVRVLAGGAGPQTDGDEEGGDPEADHEAAPVVAPGGKLSHRRRNLDRLAPPVAGATRTS